MTAAEKARLEALRKIAVAERTAEEAVELASLEAMAAAEIAKGATYSEDYVKTLRDEAAKARLKNKEIADKLSAFDGVDLEELKRLKAEKAESDLKIAEAEQAKLLAAGDYEKLQESLKESHKVELARVSSGLSEKDQKILALEGELNRTVLANDIANAAAIAKAWNPKLVEMVVTQNTKVKVLEDGSRVACIVNADGSTRLDNTTGLPMSIPQYIEVLKQSDEYAGLFSGGKHGAGSGSGGERKDDGVVNPWMKATFNLTKQGQIMEADPALAARLKAEAGK